MRYSSMMRVKRLLSSSIIPSLRSPSLVFHYHQNPTWVDWRIPRLNSHNELNQLPTSPSIGQLSGCGLSRAGQSWPFRLFMPFSSLALSSLARRFVASPVLQPKRADRCRCKISPLSQLRPPVTGILWPGRLKFMCLPPGSSPRLLPLPLKS